MRSRDRSLVGLRPAKLYYSPGSCSIAPHIALAEADVEYELILVDTKGGQQRSPEFLAKNPLGRVPVLQTPLGLLTEVSAILGYIASIAVARRLIPEDAFDAAVMASFNSFLSSTVHVTFAHFMRPYRWADDPTCKAELSRKAVAAYSEQFGMIENGKLRGPWVMGQQFTIADPYLYVMTRWLARAGIAVENFPRVNEHYSRMGARAAVQRSLVEEGFA